ncbi:MAG: polyprenyl diphosphate synthase [Desulfovibrio sp.]|uniref:polyprenyl diphosphate synthase n=1 Tax=Desulfovibrio sp. 7SRBS1 TaxID=3378064 RepID=UPI003B40B979
MNPVDAPSATAPAVLPRHLGIIMDGNGRWATRRGLSRSDGHKAGTEATRAIVTRCRELGIRHLTLYTFSTENWKRSKDEVSYLFNLLASFLSNELGTLMEQGIRLHVLGEIDALPFATRQALQHAIKKSAQNRDMDLNLALNYSGREEILRAARIIAEKAIPSEEITDELFSSLLYTAGQSDPDLIIRTSGELRLSNFLLYQSSYAELCFPDTLWPDFSPAHLDEALADFASRQRRFGDAH